MDVRTVGEMVVGVGKHTFSVKSVMSKNTPRKGKSLLNNFNVFYYCTKNALEMNILREKEIQ